MASAVLLAAALLSVLVFPFSSLALTQDFCVADLSAGDTPSGYPCKRNVTADDFHYAGLAGAGQLVPLFNIFLASAFVQQFPAMNGLGLSAAKISLAPGGVVPLHTHPRASEIIFVLRGEITAGFISAADNTVYTKTLGPGEMFVFPQGLLHYQYNAGPTAAAELAVFSNPNPGLQPVGFTLFGNDLPTQDVQKISFLSRPEVLRLKKVFGGSG